MLGGKHCFGIKTIYGSCVYKSWAMSTAEIESLTEIAFSNVKLNRKSLAQPFSAKIESLQVK